jgi:hypothetical protein
MRKLAAFESVTMDGYFSGPNGDLSWAHRPEKDSEFERLRRQQMQKAEVCSYSEGRHTK